MSTPDPLENPYQPPRAPLGDDEAETMGRPRFLDLAVWLLVASLGLGLLNALQFVRNVSPEELASYALSSLVSIAILGGLTYGIWKGQNWARIVLLLLLLVGVPISLKSLPTMFAGAPLFAGIFALQSLLQVVSALLLFVTPARRWFSTQAREQRAA